MTRARGVYGLHVAIGVVGALATALALGVALSAVSFYAPAAGVLLSACRSVVLPQVTVASLVALTMGSLAFAVLALAVRSAWRQVRASRRFVAGLDVEGPAPVGPGEAVVFADRRPQAFCAGLLRPRVYLSRGALDALSAQELEAVIAHEAHHARYRDPLRVLLARMLSDALFFLPVLRRLSDRYAALAELAADDAAVRHHDNDPQPLAAALLVFERTASPAVVGIAPERVDHLLGEAPRWELPLALLAWSAVIIGAIVAVALRTADATAHAAVNLPLLATQLCMVAMAVVPLVAGAGALLAARRKLPRAQ